MRLPSLGAMATAPMNSVDWPSVSGVQLLPPSVVLHTPPPAAAMNMRLALLGSGAMPTVRPATTLAFTPNGPLTSDAGPMSVQLALFSGMEGGGLPGGSNP